MAMIDITGERSGLLVAVEFSHTNKQTHKAIWLCRCDCGNTCYRQATLIRNKKVLSCGCVLSNQICKICGAPITNGKRGTAYCSEECREKGHLLRSKKSYIKKMENVKKKKNKDISILDQTLAELEAYNKEHNTRLSYGQFVHMQRMEQLKNEK